MLNSVLPTEIWFGPMRPVYTYPLLYLLRNLQACVFPRKMHRALRRSKTSGPAALNEFTLWRPYAAKRGKYDRTKRFHGMRLHMHHVYELRIAFMSRFLRSYVWFVISCRSMQNTILSTRRIFPITFRTHLPLTTM